MPILIDGPHPRRLTSVEIDLDLDARMREYAEANGVRLRHIFERGISMYLDHVEARTKS